MKKLGPFSLEKRSLGGGKWVGRKEQSLVCCNGKGGQLFSVPPVQGKKPWAPTAAGKVRSKMRLGRPWDGQFGKVIQAPSDEVAGNKPLLERIQVESCL